MPEEPSSAAMALPDEYKSLIDQLEESAGAESRSIIVAALNYVNSNGSNAANLVLNGELFDGSTFALVDGSSEDPGLREYFGNELITRS